MRTALSIGIVVLSFFLGFGGCCYLCDKGTAARNGADHVYTIKLSK